MHLLIKEAAVGAEGSFINIFTCNLVQVINPSIHYSTHSKALLLFNVNEKRPRVSKTFTFANVKVLAFYFIRQAGASGSDYSFLIQSLSVLKALSTLSGV